MIPGLFFYYASNLDPGWCTCARCYVLFAILSELIPRNWVYKFTQQIVYIELIWRYQTFYVCAWSISSYKHTNESTTPSYLTQIGNNLACAYMSVAHTNSYLCVFSSPLFFFRERNTKIHRGIILENWDLQFAQSFEVICWIPLDQLTQNVFNKRIFKPW